MKKCIRIFSVIMVIFMAFSSLSVSAYSTSTEKFMMDLLADIDLSYKNEIKPYFYPEIFKGDTDIWFYYNMLYAHYENSQSEPEYVVFIAKTSTWHEPAIVTRSVGDCLIYNSSINYPYDLAHYVYVPSLQKVYTLEEAYNSEELDISDAMRSGRVGLHRGDINYDRSCDILDVTIIQRHLADLVIDEDVTTGRMDLDGSEYVSILDATKLQRYLARIDDSLTVVASVE